MIANVRYMTGLLAVILAAALLELVRYAAGEDLYYMSGVSRWEHADRWGKTPIVAAAMVISGVTVIGLLASTFVSGAFMRRLALLASALSGVMLLAAWFFLTAGH